MAYFDPNKHLVNTAADHGIPTHTLTLADMPSHTHGIIYTAADMNSYLREDYHALWNPVCEYCGTRGGEDKYHPGTCANCGAALK